MVGRAIGGIRVHRLRRQRGCGKLQLRQLRSIRRSAFLAEPRFASGATDVDRARRAGCRWRRGRLDREHRHRRRSGGRRGGCSAAPRKTFSTSSRSSSRSTAVERRRAVDTAFGALLTGLARRRGRAPRRFEAGPGQRDNCAGKIERRRQEMVGVRGFEPPTPSSRTRCATRLRYTPTTPRTAQPAL